MTDDIVAYKLTISGRVQGVGFRAWALGEAEARGLYGWVRNRHNGSVEALVKGAKTRVAEFIDVCRRGPESSRVDSVVPAPAIGGCPNRFEVKPTV